MSDSQRGWLNGFYGRYHTNESRRKNSESHKGKHPTEETRKKISKSLLGNIRHLGKHHTIETKQIMGESHRGKCHSLETKRKIGDANRGKKKPLFTSEHRRKLSEAERGKKNWNWLGGKSFESYGLEFNRILKEEIRNRDNHRCQECGIHHIDYVKTHNFVGNLISLCLHCHMKTNFSRKDWTNHFMEKMTHVCSI
jgi:hypothetical protein